MPYRSGWLSMGETGSRQQVSLWKEGPELTGSGQILQGSSRLTPSHLNMSENLVPPPVDARVQCHNLLFPVCHKNTVTLTKESEVL